MLVFKNKLENRYNFGNDIINVWQCLFLCRSGKKTRETPERQENPQNHAEYIKRQNGGATGQPAAAKVDPPITAQGTSSGPSSRPVTSAKSRAIVDSSGIYIEHFLLRKKFSFFVPLDFKIIVTIAFLVCLLM
jgi:hypothetical protein